MKRLKAQGAVITSAMVVFGLFVYRKLLAETGAGTEPASTSEFVTGFFVVYLTLSVMAQAAPSVGGSFAWLVMLGDLLANGQTLVKDVDRGLGTAAAATTSTTTTARKGA